MVRIDVFQLLEFGSFAPCCRKAYDVCFPTGQHIGNRIAYVDSILMSYVAIVKYVSNGFGFPVLVRRTSFNEVKILFHIPVIKGYFSRFSPFPCNQSDNMQNYTGDSFRDLTRIAQINELMWSELFLMNKEPLLQMMKLFRADFDKLTNYIENDDKQAIMEMMRVSTARRKLFNK